MREDEKVLMSNQLQLLETIILLKVIPFPNSLHQSGYDHITTLLKGARFCAKRMLSNTCRKKFLPYVYNIVFGVKTGGLFCGTCPVSRIPAVKSTIQRLGIRIFCNNNWQPLAKPYLKICFQLLYSTSLIIIHKNNFFKFE